MNHHPGRRPGDFGVGFAIWFAFCAVIGLAWLGVLIWLVIAAIQWLGRH